MLECNIRRRGLLKYFLLALRHWALRHQYDAMLVMFPGQETMFIARLISRKPIVFDAFTSHYGGYILDRRYYSPRSLRALFYRFLDRWSCRLADAVLLDTTAHINFFVKEFKLPREKFQRIFVGTDSSVFFPRPAAPHEQFIVHFHGSYIPLHGVPHIVRAAKILERENIFFRLVGKGQTFAETKALAERLRVSNVEFSPYVSYEQLAAYIGAADVCLGIFGDTPKAEIVIPNKIYEALASKRPAITADTKAVRELLTNNENVFLCKAADPEDLARVIMVAKESNESRQRIARNGYEIFQQLVSEEIIGKELLAAIHARIPLPH